MPLFRALMPTNGTLPLYEPGIIVFTDSLSDTYLPTMWGHPGDIY